MRDNKKQLPINIASIEQIYDNNMIYVDKTEIIYNIVSRAGRYFLSRPRRFGKTLLISLINVLFQGEKKYFKDLWIGKNDHWDFKPYPILLFDFNGIANANSKKLQQALGNTLEITADKYGIKLRQSELKAKLIELILKMKKKYNTRIIVLADEYDKPIIDHLGAGDKRLKIAKKNRTALKSFFGTFKNADVENAVHFLLITGVSKFSHTSIFSELNNLTDLTMNKKYAALLGYTEEEIIKYFQQWINKWSLDKKIPESNILKKLQRHYNGFRFSTSNQQVYNPISILNSLDSQDYSNYWFDTATPSFLINLLVEKNFYIPKIESLSLYKKSFTTYELEALDPLALMFQTGYLTIKNVINETKFNFDFPNIEVKQAFLNLLMEKYGRISSEEGNYDQFNIHDDLKNKQFNIAINSFQAIFDTVPYSEEQDSMWFHRFFYMMFRNACPDSRTLDSKDKIILKFETDQSVVIVGFSCDLNANELLKCLLKSKYAESDEKEINYLSIYFDKEKRKISNWQQDSNIPKYLKISKDLAGTVKTTKIFLASSSDLLEERKEIALWVSRKNKMLLKKNQFLELVIWEELLHSFQGQRVQDYFNKEMLGCDIVVVLFYSKIGKFTQEEFNLAYNKLKSGKKPDFLFVGFKTTPPKKITKDYIEIITLREKIENDEQLYISFDYTDSLILKLDNQINKIIHE